LRCHEWQCPSNENRKIAAKKWSDEQKAAWSAKCKETKCNVSAWTPERREAKRIKSKEVNVKYWSDNSARAAHSARMLKAVKKHPDSYSKNNVCGRVKIIEYAGQKLKGNWELIVAKWLDSHGVEWIVEYKSFPYVWEGVQRLYFPDFYLPLYNVYIEVKGYKRDVDEAKWSQFPEKLVIINKKYIHKLNKFDSVSSMISACEYTNTVEGDA
jgi:hypothetical protein